MARAFHRTCIAGISAAAILITAIGAGPAQARDRDNDRLIAALLGLAVVGAIIANQDDDDHDRRVIVRNGPHHGIDPRPLPRRAQRHLLPDQCLRVVEGHRGRAERVFGGRCLRETYPFAESLPRNCAQDLRGGRGAGHGVVWNAQCLERNGYRLSRR